MKKRAAGQSSFSDVALAGLGGPKTAALLAKLDAAVPWDALVAPVLKLPEYVRTLADPSLPGGRPIDPRVMLKGLMLQKWHNLSDPQLEEQLKDRISFRRFVGWLREPTTVVYRSIRCRSMRKVGGPVLCLLLLPLLFTGCPHLTVPAPSVSGTWSGEYVSVHVQDREGRQYAAAGLRIESGPRTLKHSHPTFQVPDGHVAMLTTDGGSIIDADSMGVAEGARVRVSGVMFHGLVGVRVEETPGKPKIRWSVRRTADAPPGGSLLIQMEGAPKVIGDVKR